MPVQANLEALRRRVILGARVASPHRATTFLMVGLDRPHRSLPITILVSDAHSLGDALK